MPAASTRDGTNYAFAVTDIIVGYTVSWGDNDGLIGGFENLQAYLDRLHEREHRTLRRPG